MRIKIVFSLAALRIVHCNRLFNTLIDYESYSGSGLMKEDFRFDFGVFVMTLNDINFCQRDMTVWKINVHTVYDGQ